MKNRLIFTLLLIVSFTSSGSSIDGGLFPEDGSMPFSRWFYSKGKSSPKSIEEITTTFKQEGIKTISFPHYDWMQDILFFDQAGNFIEMARIPAQSAYFDDFTLGVFEDEGWGGRLTKLRQDEFSHFPEIGIKNLSHTFLEGGATISGKFATGENYLIITQERMDKLITAYTHTIDSQKSPAEVLEIIATELKILKENIFLIPAKAGLEHLDLYIKAMPNGVILLDDPAAKTSLIKNLYEETKNPEYLKILAFEESKNYQARKNVYNTKIELVYNLLTPKFRVIKVPGRFFQMEEANYGITYLEEKINFFNGVYGENQNKFFITNKAQKTPELEHFWKRFLADQFNINEQNIHFIGDYSSGAGLDCMGSAAP